MNKKIMWLSSLLLPLSAAAAIPQFTVVDLGITSKPGNAVFLQAPQPQSNVSNSLQSLGGVPPYNTVYAAFNAIGIAVGTSSISMPGDLTSTEAALWNQNGVTGLGFLPGAGPDVHGGPNSTAYALNSVGDVVGQSSTAFDEEGIRAGFYVAYHAFLWNSGVMHDLGTLAIPNPDPAISQGWGSSNYDSLAQGVNDSHEVVGWADSIASADNSVLQRAFLYANGTMYNLSFFLAGNPAIRLSSAYSIDCQGNIGAVGYAVASGATHAYLLLRVGPARNCPT